MRDFADKILFYNLKEKYLLNKREIGIIGLGRMGYQVAMRLCEKGYRIVAHDHDEKVSSKIIEKNCVIASSLQEFSTRLEPPRIVILLIPSGAAVKSTIENLQQHLSRGDIILEFGNSDYRDSIKMAELLQDDGINFMDVGISGGTSGARNGASLTVGGPHEIFKDIEFLFRDIATENGCKWIGPHGWGHLTKTIHNGIEYGFMQSIAEGLHTLKKMAEKENISIDLKGLCEVWNQGSIIESRLIADATQALDFIENNRLSGRIGGGETGNRAAQIARDAGLSVPALEAALKKRKDSQNHPDFCGEIIAALRHIFGGHNPNG